MTKHTKTDPSPSATQDKNRDPLSGTPGAHPVGTGAGAASGAAAGAAIGTAVGGPVGLAIGGVAGAVVGGLAGKGVAESVNPTAEDAYWRDNYASRPYVTAGQTYDVHQPAYRYGWESRSRNAGKAWNEVESELGRGWEEARGKSEMVWDEAKVAAHDAWDRLDGDNDRMDDDGASVAERRKQPIDR